MSILFIPAIFYIMEVTPTCSKIERQQKCLKLQVRVSCFFPSALQLSAPEIINSWMYSLPELFYVGVSKRVSNFYKLWVIFILQHDLISDILNLK